MQIQSKSKTVPNKKRRPLFPQRLYDMLENAERFGYDHVISWLPDGKSFKIHADAGCLQFEDGGQGGEQAIVDVLQRSGFNQKRYKSFLRQLQLYGFERTFIGPRRGECKHAFLVRDSPELLQKKSIEDFLNKTNSKIVDEIIHFQSDSQNTILQVLEPTELFLKNDNYNYWMPSFPSLAGTDNYMGDMLCVK